MRRKQRVVILGGGLAGLATAYHLLNLTATLHKAKVGSSVRLQRGGAVKAGFLLCSHSTLDQFCSAFPILELPSLF